MVWFCANFLLVIGGVCLVPLGVLGWDDQDTIFPNLPIAVRDSENKLCNLHSDQYARALDNLTLWAHEMWDASAKSTTGVLRGSVFHMGHYEQCLTARAPFPTQYCLATLSANLEKPEKDRDELSLYFSPEAQIYERLYKYNDMSQQSRHVIKVGWCVPATCQPKDLQVFLDKYLQGLNHSLIGGNVTFWSSFDEAFCSKDRSQEGYTSADLLFCVVTGLLIGLVITTTVADLYSTKRDKYSGRSTIWWAFSAKRNFKDLNKMDESNPALSILYGMRTICIFMIILGHRFGTFVSAALLNFNYIESEYRNLMAALIFHGDLFVDSFFVLSGLLVVYTLMGQFEKKSINPAFIILLRYIRLTPVYAFVIFYYATLFNYTGDGPMWKVIAGGDSNDCKENWWTNLLYISNYVNADHMCMTHSWYLPCDFHYFIIGIGVCLLIRKEKKLGLSSLLLLTIMSLAVPFFLTFFLHRPALLYFYPEFLTGPKVHPDFLLSYCKSHTRATPYFIGMFAGYLYYKLKGVNYHVGAVKSMVVNVLSLLLLLAPIFGGAVFYNPYHKYNSIEAASYASFHRIPWAVGSVGLLFIASYGHSTIVRAVLTWSPWVPLSKLVYSAYLVHMQFQLRSAAKFQNPRQFGYFDVISLGLSDIVLAFMTALVLYLAIESPFRIIFKHLLMPSRDGRHKDQTDSTATHDNMINNNQDSRL